MGGIVQFGTSRFLQAHADLFFSEAVPPRDVTVVQTSGDAGRAQRLPALAAPGGFPVRIRGIEDGRTIDETRQVTSVKAALSTRTDWAQVETAVIEADAIISNTGDDGFRARPQDAEPRPSKASSFQAMSFPAKLAHLLHARHQAGRNPVAVFPLELIQANGAVLRGRVLEVAECFESAGFVRWLEGGIWADSVVDRIVSEPIDPAGAVAEPYALWAIEEQPGLLPPARHPAIRMVASLEEVQRLKLHILNLGHTALVDAWQRSGAPDRALVRELIAGRPGSELRQVLENEVLPGFAVRGMGDAARSYLSTTWERYANPYLDHRLSDIAQNHTEKASRRIGAFLAWVRQVDAGQAAPVLEGIFSRSQSR